MLEIKNLTKVYKTDNLKQVALDDISINFRENEFASILGPSGSGKTTLLNVIGGLDHYDKGNLIINEVSTKRYKDRDWDAYRNHRVGFVFQNYNLISHQTILKNVELALTLSGVSRTERTKLAKEALEKVGLKSHLNKKPSQLSGGQQQRVAIARALVNNPDIILADEPTGALDSETSRQIMELLKKVAEDKLVIMVTHNPELAEDYSTRIIKLKDGKIVGDTNPYDGAVNTRETRELHKQKSKKTSMGFKTALSLSLNNLLTKKGRTFLTAFAGSIGIVGIALILSLSSGVNQYIEKTEKETLASYPLTISKDNFDLNAFRSGGIAKVDCQIPNFCTTDTIIPNPITNTKSIKSETKIKTKNNLVSLKKTIDDNYENINNYVSDIKYTYDLNLQIYHPDYEKEIIKINSDNFSEILLLDQYEIIDGRLPEKFNELVLVTNQKGELPTSLVPEGYDYKTLIGNSYKLLQDPGEIASVSNLKSKLDTAENLEIVGIIKPNANNAGTTNGFVGYTEKLSEHIIKNFNSEEIELSEISIYPNNYTAKEEIKRIIEQYNSTQSEENKINYTDYISLLMNSLTSVVDIISYVLIAFVAISLIVSSIMIAIITYISVLERTKEIGILRAIGASKKDVSRVFTSETIIEGFIAGVLGIAVTFLLCAVANRIIFKITGVNHIASLNPLVALILIAVSILLTMLAGFIPAKIASKKDPVESLRTE